MLDLELSSSHKREMPIDTLYQLGTSPPSFGFLYSFQQVSLNPTAHGICRSVMRSATQNFEKADAEQPLRSCLRILDKSKEMVPTYQTCDFPEESTESAHVTVSRCRTIHIEKMTATSVVTSEKIEQIKPNKKKVCFADSKGLRLHTIRIMDGPSDAPPMLDVNLFKEVIQDERAKPNHPYTYVPDFDQPASNYLDFRERLEKNKVCLENVVIKDNITIMGTVKVRNISFEKSVKIRVTFDEWNTFRDIPATFVFPTPTLGEENRASSSDKYDTFSFQFDLPPNLGGRAAYFCICYECNHTSFWDNNKQINYRIISLEEKESSEHEKLVESYENLSGDYPWTDISVYTLADKERPYW